MNYLLVSLLQAVMQCNDVAGIPTTALNEGDHDDLPVVIQRVVEEGENNLITQGTGLRLKPHVTTAIREAGYSLEYGEYVTICTPKGKIMIG